MTDGPADAFSVNKEKKVLVDKIGRFILDPPLPVTVSNDGNEYTLDSDEGRFHLAGLSEDELMSDLRDCIDFVWRNYVNGNPDNMTPGAKAYRDRLSSFIREA